MKITVIVIDDEAILRQSIRAALEADPDIRVVGEAWDWETGVSLVKRWHPEVITLDIRLGEDSGITLCKAVTNVSPGTRVLVLSAYDDSRYVKAMVQLGVSGYLLKTASGKELCDAVHAVVTDKHIFVNGVAGRPTGPDLRAGPFFSAAPPPREDYGL